jgi:hypothetical protein
VRFNRSWGAAARAAAVHEINKKTKQLVITGTKPDAGPRILRAANQGIARGFSSKLPSGGALPSPAASEPQPIIDICLTVSHSSLGELFHSGFSR